METKVAMWRSVRKEDYPNGPVVDGKIVEGILYPSFEDTLITSGPRKGESRLADARIDKTKDGIFVLPGGGTSLFDKKDVFGAKHWVCFTIPAGTTYDPSLKLVGPEENKRYNADHYQIEPRTRMRIDAFKGALDNFARNALAREFEQSR